MDPISRCENVRELVLSRVATDLVQLEQLLRLLAEHHPPPEHIRLQNVTLVEPSEPVNTSPFLTHKFRSIKVIGNGSPAVLSDILMWVQQVGCVEIGHSSSGKENRGPSVALKERAQSQRIIAGEFKAPTEDLCWLDVFDQEALRILELGTPRGRGAESGPSTTTLFTSLKAKLRKSQTEPLPLNLEVLKQFPQLYRFAVYAHLDDFSQQHAEYLCPPWTSMPHLDSYFMQVALDTKKKSRHPLDVETICINHYDAALQCTMKKGFTFGCAELPSEDDPSGYRSLSLNIDLENWLRFGDGTHAWREVVDKMEVLKILNLNVALERWLNNMKYRISLMDVKFKRQIKFEVQYVDFGRGIYGSYERDVGELQLRSIRLLISPQLRASRL